MDLLNLDDVLPPKRTITLRNVKHDVLPMDVDAFIRTTRAAVALEKLQRKEGADVPAMVELMMDTITATVPTLTKEILGSLSLEQLGKINSFLRGEFDEKAQAEAQEATAAKGAKTAPKKRVQRVR